jgi:hypothetical protein
VGTLGDCCADFSDMSIMLIRTLHPMPSQLETIETRRQSVPLCFFGTEQSGTLRLQ